MGAPPQKHCDTGAKMPLITLKNVPRSETFVTSRDPQTDCPIGFITQSFLAVQLQKEFCRVTKTAIETVAVDCGGHQLIESSSQLIIEVSNLAWVEGIIHDDFKNIARYLGEIADTVLNKKFVIEVYIKRPLIPHEDVVWKR